MRPAAFTPVHRRCNANGMREDYMGQFLDTGEYFEYSSKHFNTFTCLLLI